MQPAYSVGDTAVLPSGIRAPLLSVSDPNSPWTATVSDGVWVVRRQSPTGTDTIYRVRLYPNADAVLDQIDAVALADALNTVMPVSRLPLRSQVPGEWKSRRG